MSRNFGSPLGKAPPGSGQSSSPARPTPATTPVTRNASTPRLSNYRGKNLLNNGVDFVIPMNKVPVNVINTVNAISGNRSTPEPPANVLSEQIEELKLFVRGGSESDLRSFFQLISFPARFNDSTFSGDKRVMSMGDIPLASHLIPVAEDRISVPIPDLMYGYSMQTAFTTAQRLIQKHLDPYNEIFAEATSNGNFRFLFLFAEFKKEDDHVTAENQLAGAFLAGHRLIDCLNRCLETYKYPGKVVDNILFGLTVENRVAELYVA